MTRSFSKSNAGGQIRLTALCVAIALGWMVHGAPSLADNTQIATADTTMAMAHIC